MYKVNFPILSYDEAVRYGCHEKSLFYCYDNNLERIFVE